MVTNPAVLVRALMDPATRVSAARRQGAVEAVDVTLKEGDQLTAAFAATGLPAWIRWATRHTNVGQMNFTTTFSGWSDATGTSGLLLPLAYQTRLSYRNVDYVKLYVDTYRIDTAIADLAVPAAVRAAPEPPSYPVPDDHVEGDREGDLAGGPGRHHSGRVPRPPGAVRVGRQRGDGQGRHRPRPHPGARQAGDPPRRQPSPLRPHGRAAAGRGRGAHHRPASRQRASVPRHGVARRAGLPGRPGQKPAATEVPGGRRAPAHVRRGRRRSTSTGCPTAPTWRTCSSATCRRRSC